jgi:hypothetical protein
VAFPSVISEVFWSEIQRASYTQASNWIPEYYLGDDAYNVIPARRQFHYFKTLGIPACAGNDNKKYLITTQAQLELKSGIPSLSLRKFIDLKLGRSKATHD